MGRQLNFVFSICHLVVLCLSYNMHYHNIKIDECYMGWSYRRGRTSWADPPFILLKEGRIQFVFLCRFMWLFLYGNITIFSLILITYQTACQRPMADFHIYYWNAILSVRCCLVIKMVYVYGMDLRRYQIIYIYY